MAILKGLDNGKKAGQKPAFRIHTTSAKLTEEELEAFNKLAGRQAIRPAELLRSLILKAIEDDKNPTISDPLFTELIGLKLFLVNALQPVCSGKTLEPREYDSLVQTVRKAQAQKAEEIAHLYRKEKVV